MTQADPYIMLAFYIASHFPKEEIIKFLTDDAWTKRQIRQECYALDLRGHFLDVLLEYMDNHNRLWLRRQWNAFADAMFTQLDVEHLRELVTRITGIKPE